MSVLGLDNQAIVSYQKEQIEEAQNIEKEWCKSSVDIKEESYIGCVNEIILQNDTDRNK